MIAIATEPLLTADLLLNLVHRDPVRTWDWACENAFNRDGRPFDPEGYPQHEGVYDAFDDPRYRFLCLQWATRLGKTFIGQTCAMKVAARDPRPMMFSSASENAVSDTLMNTFVPMLLACPELRDQVPARINRHSINLLYCRMKAAWSGSKTRLADSSIWFQHNSEVDKWSTNKSTEADPLELAIERTKEYPDRKVIIESTPGLKGHSRINPWLLQSTNCRRQVPCPWCHKYQELEFKRVVWDKDGDRSDPDLAKRTARYACCHCDRDIHDEHRPRMFRAGLWVPEGCWVDGRGRIKGEQKYRGDVWGSQLSSLHSTNLSWGDIAWQFLRSKNRPTELQNFVNSTLGELWEPHRSKSTPEMVAERLKCDVPRYMVASGASFLTCGVDVQQDHLKYVIVAWGECERGWLVDYGAVDTWDDLQAVLDHHYVREEDGQAVGIRLTLIDSRYRQPEVRAFCREHHRPGRAIIPSMGQSTLGGLPFRLSTKTADGKKLVHSRMSIQVDLVEINTNYYQDLIQQYLDDGRPGEEGGFAIFAEAAEDMEFLCELLNEVQSGKVNTRGYTELLWVQKNEAEPNDFRDALRYARCAADVFARGNWRRPQTPGKPAAKPIPVPDTSSQQPRRKLAPFGKSNIIRKSGWLNRRE